MCHQYSAGGSFMFMKFMNEKVVEESRKSEYNVYRGETHGRKEKILVSLSGLWRTHVNG